MDRVCRRLGLVVLVDVDVDVVSEGLALGRGESFEFGGWDVTQRAVQAAGVKPGEVFDDRELELAASAPDAVGDQLGLDRVDEALGDGVVIGIAD
jgi:hypothetical protein